MGSILVFLDIIPNVGHDPKPKTYLKLANLLSLLNKPDLFGTLRPSGPLRVKSP